MNKVWIVEGSRGSWDDWNWFIVGIYTNKEDAEAEKDKIVNEINISMGKYTNEDQEFLCKKLDEYFDSDEYKETQKLTDELDEYYNWKYGLKPMDYNIQNFTVNEYDLNKRVFKFES